MEINSEDKEILERLESELWREETRFNIQRMNRDRPNLPFRSQAFSSRSIFVPIYLFNNSAAGLSRANPDVFWFRSICAPVANKISKVF
jgi:hypothetical protein